MDSHEYKIRGEFHCHNCYSNGMDSVRLPLESPVRPLDQLREAKKKGLDFIIITNHNTLDGYEQMLECRNDYPELRDIEVYAGEEVSALLPNGTLGHVLGWGLSETVEQGMSVEETVDEIKSQGAVSCAAHPYGFMDYTRDKAVCCDLIEAFNSNNIDIYSNVRAYESVRKWKKFGMAGSDAHTLGTMGKCTVVVHADNTIDDVLRAVSKGQFEIEKASYVSKTDIIDYFRYQLSDTVGMLADITNRYGRTAERIVKSLVDWYMDNPDAFWIEPVSRMLMAGARNISRKVNIYGYGESLFNVYAKGYKVDYSSYGRMLMESFMPLDIRKFGYIVEADDLWYANPKEALNRLNEGIREHIALPKHDKQ